MNNYDIIGDIHGHADALEQLLQKMGYMRKAGVYSHPDDRKVLFVGDFIDRGPKIRETLHLVRDMIDAGNAKAVMGNHEYNAVCFHTPHTEDGQGFFRKHSVKEIEQHLETLRQFKHYETEWNDFVDWFRTLPLFLDLPECRVVHAYWNDSHIEWLRNNYTGLTTDFLNRCTVEGSQEYKVVEDTLKGAEKPVPNGGSFLDKDGNKRGECRLKWWSTKRGSYGDVYMECPEEYLLMSLMEDFEMDEYVGRVPVFFGHYWLKGNPKMENPNSVCLDYSVARGGKLVAARLSNGEFEFVY
jgi:hypothetical protein